MRIIRGNKNLKSDYEQTLDENFNKAWELCLGQYTHNELMCLLKNGNIAEKQFAALELSKLDNINDAKIFLSNLINCDGKIREAIALKFYEFVHIEEYKVYFKNYPQILAKATIDINANISRMVIDGLKLMSDDKVFGKKYLSEIKRIINESFAELDKIEYKDKKYTINKQLFKLYWCLEGVKVFVWCIDETELIYILEKALEQKEYTIREKIAQIIAIRPLLNMKNILNILSEDNNYYIKRVL